MKKTLSIAALVFMACLLCTSCKTSQQNAGKLYGQVEESTEIILPFSGKEYKSDSNYFRAVNQGKSPDMATAKKIAMANAITEIGTRIQNTVKAVTNQYTNQRNVADAVNFEKKFEEMARIVVNQVTQNIDVIGEKCFKGSDGQYTYWIVLETEKDQVIKQMSSSVSNNAELKLDFDEYMFTKIFDEEMKKFEGQ